jgi:hypothetical protein
VRDEPGDNVVVGIRQVRVGTPSDERHGIVGEVPQAVQPTNGVSGPSPSAR